MGFWTKALDKILTNLHNKKFKTSIFYLLPAPLVLNLAINIFNGNFVFALQNSSASLEAINLLLGFCLYILYIFVGKVIKNILDLKYVMSGVAIFWLLLFSFDNVFIFFTKYLNFYSWVITFFILFLIFCFIKKIDLKDIFLIFCLLFLIRYFVDYLFSQSIEITFLAENLFTTDESKLWLPATQIIFNENYFHVLTNNPYPGYGLFTSYVGALNSLVLLQSDDFKYLLGVNYVTIFLFFHFLYEVAKSKKTLLINYLIFSSILLTSSWFTYVFFGSLLSEGIASFCFGVLFTEIVNHNKKINNKFYLVLYLFGFLYFTRQFLSVLVVIYLSYLFLRNKNFKYLIGLVPLVIKSLQSNFVPNVTFDAYINEGLLNELYFNFYNIPKTFKQFFIDKPITYFFLIFIFVILIYFKKIYNNIDFLSIISLNTLMVFALMVFFWNKSDVESSYRYLLSIFYLTIYPFSEILDSHFSN